MNKISNIRFLVEDSSKYMVSLAAAKEKVDVVLMDPPRKGSTKEFIDSVNALNPSRVVYVSCDPETLKRDLEYFVKKGWRVKKIQPVDMFPYTKHVETVVLLTHQKQPDDYLRIHVDLDELDKTKSESKATYGKIKEYISDKYDMKVSSLCIAQVKRDFGIIERANYNLGEGKSTPRHCSKEKYKAIVDALKFFRMIA